LLSSILFVCLAVGCNDGRSSTHVAVQPAGGPAIHFVTDTAVTRVFLPERVEVRLTGLPPESRVTLHASMPGYASHATFRADAAGSLDVASQAPEEGTYEGVDAEGLFWSMVATGAPPGDDIDVEVRAEVEGVEIAAATLARYATEPGVVEEEVHDDGLVGVLAVPAAPGPHPALLTFGGSEGGIAWARRAALLHASLGYTCLGLAYFRAPGLPARLDDVPLEYFARALQWMAKRPEVKADALGVIGVSRGGELALVLGARFPEVRAVVAEVPSGVVWPGDPVWPAPPAGAWTVGGEELSYVPLSSGLPVYSKDSAGHRVEHDAPMVAAALAAASPAALQAATTRVEDTRGAVLMLAAADDQIWPSCRLAAIAWDRLVAAGHAGTFADDFVCHPDAGHLTGTPGLPTTDAATRELDSHTWLAFGGTPAGTARAARDGFERRRAFLARALR
jgi:dienelactone hydrolase